MRVLVVGGLGYLGSILTDVLSKSGQFEQVDICDIGIWGNIETKREIDHNTFYEKKIEPKHLEFYDAIVWAANIDVPQFYNDNDKFLEKNIWFFEECCVRTKRFINCSSYSMNFGFSGKMYDHLNKLEEIVNCQKQTNIRIPSLHGPSPKMRWDTYANELFFHGLLKKQICLEGDWLVEIPLASSLDMAYKIFELILAENTTQKLNFCTEKMYLIQIAHVVKEFIGKEMEVITMKNCDLIKCKGFDYITEPRQNLSKSYEILKYNIDQDNLPDYISDRYNNGTIVELSKLTSNFHRVTEV